jgi:hypothetical protein
VPAPEVAPHDPGARVDPILRRSFEGVTRPPGEAVKRSRKAREAARVSSRPVESFRVTSSTADVKRLLRLAIADLDVVDVNDPARCAIVRVIAAIDRLLERLDRLDRELQGMAVAVVGHAAVDAVCRLIEAPVPTKREGGT